MHFAGRVPLGEDELVIVRHDIVEESQQQIEGREIPARMTDAGS